MQWLSKHVPIARQQILNSTIVGLQQWKICVLALTLALSLVQLRVSSVQESVKRGLELEAGE
jgi:hypothetical protein